jgi:hypothetical protein
MVRTPALIPECECVSGFFELTHFQPIDKLAHVAGSF